MQSIFITSVILLISVIIILFFVCMIFITLSYLHSIIRWYRKVVDGSHEDFPLTLEQIVTFAFIGAASLGTLLGFMFLLTVINDKFL